MVVSGGCRRHGASRSKFLWRLRHNTARPDIVGADQPQPVDALFVGQVCCTWRSSVHAAPAAAWINLKEWGRGVERGAYTVSQPSWPGFVPAVHVLSCLNAAKTWMPGTKPGMT